VRASVAEAAGSCAGTAACQYYCDAILSMPIQSFRDEATAAVFDGWQVRTLSPGIQGIARRKLAMIDAAQSLRDLSIPPANRLEALKGKRAGQYSIRINDQWRICFRWQAPDAFDVQICDYHR
jgi:proteic killer suppression protein